MTSSAGRSRLPHRAVAEPASDGPVGWQGLEPDTSERLFAVDELAAYEQSRDGHPDADSHADSHAGSPDASARRPADGTDPQRGTAAPAACPCLPTGRAAAARGLHTPGAAPGLGPPGGSGRTGPECAAGPGLAAAPGRRAAPPVPPAEPEADPSVPRFMSATDFLDRRSDQVELGPATWGWRGKVRRWSGGAIAPKMGPDEMQYEHDRRAIQRDFDGPRTVAFLNPKGGAAKTTGVLAAGYTFGTVRGGGVVA